eukprot:767755-Hanusia_phi.AAC.3
MGVGEVGVRLDQEHLAKEGGPTKGCWGSERLIKGSKLRTAGAMCRTKGVRVPVFQPRFKGVGWYRGCSGVVRRGSEGWGCIKAWGGQWG